MSIEEFAEKFMKAEMEAFHQGKLDALEQLESPNIMIHMDPPLSDIVGFEAHKQYIMNARQGGEITQNWKYITGDGNVGVLSLKQSVKFLVDNPVLSLKAGANVDVDAFFVLRLENGKAAEAWIKGSITVK
jgi:hypothetical protein